MYRGSAADFSMVFCTPTAAAASISRNSSSSSNRSRFSLEPDIAAETAVLRRRPRQNPAGAPSEEDSLLDAAIPSGLTPQIIDTK